MIGGFVSFRLYPKEWPGCLNPLEKRGIFDLVVGIKDLVAGGTEEESVITTSWCSSLEGTYDNDN